ncbi:HupE/UreJ family protein [Hymenobacter cheonanensis]|uniref:HupE/UreJ family protein n=1 Tax=Hymenobacter sp. CA2-7 TaxID=3063993 RepID=UPI002712E62D|nr:HupE/UreJ family protein [Hymenobacter sp. CA2-7]MDO7888270.1 HupE/UreJ family protein [Hymenobacter sp. CA2-7]
MNLSFVRRGWLGLGLAVLLLALRAPLAAAHPMPVSVVLLTIQGQHIEAEVQIPLNELQAAFGHAVDDSSAHLVARLGPALRTYLAQHTRPQSPDGRPWAVAVGALAVHETRNPINGTYRELTAQLRLTPPPGEDVRQFTFVYDAVIHQVVTHKILVAVRQDWARGQVADTTQARVGIIALDVRNNVVPPLAINLAAGSAWTGFGAMVQLGIRHIAEGTDHLLFLLVLLLPAPLLVSGRRWGRFGGVRYSLRRLLLIVTAFTLGHSLTLLLGALGWVRLPGQPVEILIAVSILVSTAHAVRPLFPGREAWVAAGFGLVHGLAFAGTLANLHLEAGPMALSILGFNLGIELMQLFVIGLTIPWLLLLARTPAYRLVRVAGAGLAAVAATAWVVERATSQRNGLGLGAEQVAAYAPVALALLAGLALALAWRYRPARGVSAPQQRC